MVCFEQVFMFIVKSSKPKKKGEEETAEAEGPHGI